MSTSLATGRVAKVVGSGSLSYSSGLAIVLLAALLTHLPTSFSTLATDDFLIRANIMGDQALFDAGFSNANPNKPFLERLSSAFHFYSPQASTLSEYQAYGNLPWWASDEAKMTPLRPISAFTHWIDFQLAPDSFQFQVFHTLIYVLLYAFFAFRLFVRLSPSIAIATLASALLVLDYSNYVNYSWIAARNVFIAAAFSCATLERFIEWRQKDSAIALSLSLILFGLALFSAEGSIALTGYLFAYVVFAEKFSVNNTVKALLPFALLVLAWRWLYNVQGYGASGISLYVDPAHSPLEFFASLFQTLPVLLAATLTTIDGALPSFAPPYKVWFSIAGFLIVAGSSFIVYPLLKHNKLARFMFAGSIIAAVPASALVSASPRGAVFISIGFFWVLANWIAWALNHPKRFARIAGVGLLSIHSVIPATLAFLLSSTLLPITYKSDKQFESVAHLIEGQNRPLVMINTRAPNREFYLPFTWHYEYATIPSSINLLAPGMTSFHLTRIDEFRFEIHAPQGLPITANTPIRDEDGQSPPISEVYYLQMLQGLFTRAETQYPVGTKRKAGLLSVTVLETQGNAPTKIAIDFDPAHPPDEMAWQYYNWQTREYQLATPMEPGESRYYPGPLDRKRANLVEVCIDCA